MEGKWKRWYYFTILGIHVIGILIFTRGFLLTRTELPYYSDCTDISQSPCLSSSNSDGFNNASRQCWTKPAVDRLVIIVLDALRFDFVAPSSVFPEKKPWMDRLTVLQKLASTRGLSARIFKAIADPPTTSLQRLKGLTTGGLPTFIDVGNSFGAPSIVEDNFINQLVRNGKRVVMMGDDTWTQLFPDHFNKSYPYPSFNVKDLDTVDNGCVSHIFTSLTQGDWDVLIAHFLGVDHAGHIFGVDSAPMVEKLDQYNSILEKVIDILESQSRPGGLHENTLLLVMGDHGQTLNGDHGGGSAEEVETSIFAMKFNKSPSSSLPAFSASSCEVELEGNMCIGSIQQLDFAVSVSALLDVPFPYGSIGRVDPQLYALASGTLNSEAMNVENCRWVQNYINVLCINAWQVKRYIDVYSTSSVIGFSSEDLLHISEAYAQAQDQWTQSTNSLLDEHGSCNSSLPALTAQIEAYFHFLSNISVLARSKWTEFNLTMMGIGLGIMILSLLIKFVAIQRVKKPYAVFLPSFEDCRMSFESLLALLLVAMRACSFLSNSYILEEGKVANFLLATTGIVKLRYSFMRKSMLFEAVTFLLVTFTLRFSIEVGLSKQAATSSFMNASPSWMHLSMRHPVWMYMTEVGPILLLIVLAVFLCKVARTSYLWGMWKYIVMGAVASYMLIAVHWASESNTTIVAPLIELVGTSFIPRTVYAIGLGQLVVLSFGMLFDRKDSSDEQSLTRKASIMLSVWSPTVIVLAGKQGSLIALASIVGGYCIMRLERIREDAAYKTARTLTFCPLAVVQWNLLAVCLFFATGHWCAFDGLRYGAAFIGFDEFMLVRQAILLTIDTFGFSNIIPIFGLPFLAASHRGQTNNEKSFSLKRLSQMYVMYGLITTTSVIATIICVTIQRRHLMVWGLFAPKFVFDVVGLILTEVLICVASLFYSG